MVGRGENGGGGQLGEVRMGDVRMVGRSGDGPAIPITDM